MLRRPVLIAVPALLTAHVVLGLLWPPAAAGTVYVPLLALSALGLPVLGEGGGGWASPTAMGWAACALAWLSFYAGVSIVWVRLRRRR